MNTKDLLKAMLLSLEEEDISIISSNFAHDELCVIESILREGVRQGISRNLMRLTDKRTMCFDCNIPIEFVNSFGVSTLQMPTIIGLYLDPCNGMIFYALDEKNSAWYDIDNLELEYQLSILRELEKK